MKDNYNYQMGLKSKESSFTTALLSSIGSQIAQNFIVKNFEKSNMGSKMFVKNVKEQVLGKPHGSLFSSFQEGLLQGISPEATNYLNTAKNIGQEIKKQHGTFPENYNLIEHMGLNTQNQDILKGSTFLKNLNEQQKNISQIPESSYNPKIHNFIKGTGETIGYGLTSLADLPTTAINVSSNMGHRILNNTQLGEKIPFKKELNNIVPSGVKTEDIKSNLTESSNQSFTSKILDKGRTLIRKYMSPTEDLIKTETKKIHRKIE